MMNRLLKMKDSIFNASGDVKKNQYFLLSVILLVAGLCLYWFLSISDDGSNSEQKVKDKTESIDFSTPLNKVDQQGYLLTHTQNQLEAQQKQTDAIQQQIQMLSQNKNQEDNIVKQQAETIKTLQSQMDDIKKNSDKQSKGDSGQNGFLAGNGTNTNMPSDNFMSDDVLSLPPKPSSYDISYTKTPDTFVPAGTFVRAISIGGADASAGVTSQSDPSPMVFRLLDEGVLPNHAHSHLKNCVATAAAIGDISSERGLIRLERLSCTKPDGHVVEMQVQATVFGPDGKNGQRGNPVWRDGPIVQNAFWAGTLSGVSKGLGQSYTTNSITPYGAVSTVNSGRVLQYGAASGLEGGADKLSDYLTKLADQYHPVIQLSAGTPVDIVFLKGFYLDGKKHTESEPDTVVSPSGSNFNVFANATNSTQQNNNLSSEMPKNNGNTNLQPLPLTPQQIEALKSKSAQQGYF